MHPLILGLPLRVIDKTSRFPWTDETLAVIASHVASMDDSALERGAVHHDIRPLMKKLGVHGLDGYFTLDGKARVGDLVRTEILRVLGREMRAELSRRPRRATRQSYRAPWEPVAHGLEVRGSMQKDTERGDGCVDDGVGIQQVGELLLRMESKIPPGGTSSELRNDIAELRKVLERIELKNT